MWRLLSWLLDSDAPRGTAARRGDLDARRKGAAYPTAEDVVEVTLPGRQFDELRERLDAARLAKDGNAPGPDGRDTREDAVTRASASLRAALEARGCTPSPDDESLLHDVVLLLLELETDGAPAGGDKARLTHFENTLLQAHEVKIQRVLEAWESDRQAREGEAKHLGDGLRELLDDYRREHERHAKRDHRHPNVLVPAFVYFPFMVMLGILEFPINRTAFQILEPPSQLDLLLMSAGVSLGVPVLAHFFGMKIRQLGSGERTPGRFLMFPVIFLTILGALASVTVLRQQWIEHEQAAASRDAASMQAQIDAMSGRTSTAPPAPDPRTILVQTLAVAGINLAFLGAGLTMSYFAHDHDREIERIVSAKRRLRRQMERRWTRWRKVAARFDARRNRVIRTVERIQRECLQCMSEYRDWNLRRRPDRSIPQSYGSDVGMALFKPHAFGSEFDRQGRNIMEELHSLLAAEATSARVAGSTDASSDTAAEARPPAPESVALSQEAGS